MKSPAVREPAETAKMSDKVKGLKLPLMCRLTGLAGVCVFVYKQVCTYYECIQAICSIPVDGNLELLQQRKRLKILD